MIRELNYTKDFGERLAQKRERMGFPRRVIFEITHRCNLRCRHCYVVPEANRKELSTQVVKTIFDQLVDAGCLHLTLTGGEPLLREDTLSLIDYARRIGLFVHLFTNATLITSQIADKLEELQLISFEISFHSLKKERFDWFTQVEGSYDRVMSAIELLKERKLKLALKINMTKANLDEIEDLRAFVRDLGAIPQWVALMIPRSDGSKNNLFLRLEPQEVLEVMDVLSPGTIDEEGTFLGEIQENEEPSASSASSFTKTSDDETEHGPREKWAKDRLFQCGGGRRAFTISPYGELKPCPEFPSSGHLVLQSSLKEGWKMLKNYIESLRPNPEYKCFDCKLRSFCSSCPARARLECGDMNRCPDYYRQLAELTAQRVLKQSGHLSNE